MMRVFKVETIAAWRPVLLLCGWALSGTALAATIEFGPNGCSLSDAIESANFDASVGNCAAGSGTDTLIAPDGWEITLSSDLPDITSDLTLRTQTSAGRLRLSGDNARPILRITGAGTDVNIQRIEFRFGRKTGALNGGGAALNIRDATVSVVDSEFTANIVSADDGGAINVRNGVLVLRRTILRNNIARQDFIGDNRGGGIYARDSQIDLDEVLFENNGLVPEGVFSGNLSEGLFMNGGELVMNRSLVNELFRGIRAINGASLSIVNTTFEVSDVGYSDIAKLDVQGPSFVRLNHVTLGAKMAVRDSILEVTNSALDECVLTGTAWTIDSANLYFSAGCNGPQQWPGLTGLADNGGFTPTRASGPDSAVVDAGDPTYCTATDQRGEPRDGACDIGAYELSPIADLGIEVSLDPTGPWVDGQDVTAILVVTNSGPGPADAIRLDADFEQFFSTTSEASFCPSLPCMINLLGPGQTVTVPIRGVTGSHLSSGVDIDATVSSTASSNHSDPDENQPNGNNRFVLNEPIQAGADLALELVLQTAPPYFEGQTVTYQATIDNLGRQTATNVEFELLPVNLVELVSNGCDSINGVVCTINGLNDGQSAIVSVQGKINGPVFLLNGEVSAQELDVDPSNNLDDQGNQGAVNETDVSVEMTLVESPPYYSDQLLQFQIRVRSGNEPASNVRLWSEFEGATAGFISADFCFGVPCVIDTMPPNTERTATFIYFAPVAPEDGSPLNLSHRAYVEPGQVDSNPGNNEVVIQAPLVAAADLVAHVELLTSGPFQAGDVVEYEIELINGGVNRALNVVLSTTPSNLEPLFLSANLCEQVDCELSALDFTQRERLLVQYRIIDPGPFNLAATVTSDTLDPGLGNNSDLVNGGHAAPRLTDALFSDRFEP